MADQGWLAIEVPEDEGGLGLGTVEVAVLCEEIGRRLVAAPFLPSVVALGALSTPEARAEAGTKDWREALAEGAPSAALRVRRGDAVTVSSRAPAARCASYGTTAPTVFAPPRTSPSS